MDHAYAIASDCHRVQLPTFYPDASHYIYHQPGCIEKYYGQGMAEMREMQHSGATPPEVLRGMEQVPQLTTAESVVPTQPTTPAITPSTVTHTNVPDTAPVVAPVSAPTVAHSVSPGDAAHDSQGPVLRTTLPAPPSSPVEPATPNNNFRNFLFILLAILFFLGLVAVMNRFT